MKSLSENPLENERVYKKNIGTNLSGPQKMYKRISEKDLI